MPRYRTIAGLYAVRARSPEERAAKRAAIDLVAALGDAQLDLPSLLTRLAVEEIEHPREVPPVRHWREVWGPERDAIKDEYAGRKMSGEALAKLRARKVAA